jgi:hypothetical protein
MVENDLLNDTDETKDLNFEVNLLNWLC